LEGISFNIFIGFILCLINIFLIIYEWSSIISFVLLGIIILFDAFLSNITFLIIVDSLLFMYGKDVLLSSFYKYSS
jgi:hypothetical protein